MCWMGFNCKRVHRERYTPGVDGMTMNSPRRRPVWRTETSFGNSFLWQPPIIYRDCYSATDGRTGKMQWPACISLSIAPDVVVQLLYRDATRPHLCSTVAPVVRDASSDRHRRPRALPGWILLQHEMWLFRMNERARRILLLNHRCKHFYTTYT